MATSVYARSLGIGAVAGLRSMTAPAATLLAGDRPFAGLAILAGAGELIVDKLPVAPARTIPPAVAVRMLAGGFSGGAIAARFGGSRVLGIVLGALGAVAVTYLAYESAAASPKTRACRTPPWRWLKMRSQFGPHARRISPCGSRARRFWNRSRPPSRRPWRGRRSARPSRARPGIGARAAGIGRARKRRIRRRAPHTRRLRTTCRGRCNATLATASSAQVAAKTASP